MHRSPTFLTALTAALVALGTACEGAGPFAAGDETDGPNFPGENTTFTGTGQGEVTGSVEAADPSQGSLTLAGDVDVQMTGQTNFDDDGDVRTLAQVLDGLEAEAEVICVVSGEIESAVFIAAEIRCDTNATSGGPGDDSGDGSGSIARIEGQVVSVDAEDGEFMIAGGMKVRTDSETGFGGQADFESLAELEAALSDGKTINAEARGEIERGVVFASSVQFDFAAESDEEDDADTFEGVVTSVDLIGRFVVLDDGTGFEVASDALIDTEGDFDTLAEVDAAVEFGIEVRAEAEAHRNGNGNLEVIRIKFEAEDEASDDAAQVVGVVGSVNLLARTVTTTDGQVIQVGSDALVDAAGDFRTLTEVATAVTLGTRVRVEAMGTPSAAGLIASTVRFETG